MKIINNPQKKDWSQILERPTKKVDDIETTVIQIFNDVQKNGEIEIKWLDEDKIQELFEQKKIKIKHETIGVMKDKYLLTASSKELQKFITKYMASSDSEKWKTSTNKLTS